MKPNIFTEENDVILDDTIVEFRYEFNKKTDLYNGNHYELDI